MYGCGSPAWRDWKELWTNPQWQPLSTNQQQNGMIKLEPPAGKKKNRIHDNMGLAYPANNLELADKQMSLPIEKMQIQRVNKTTSGSS